MPERRSILIVDDHRDFAAGVALTLGDLDCDLEVVHSGHEALTCLSTRPVDLVLSDVRMPGMDGMALLEELRRRSPRTRVVLFTGHGTVADAVAAMQAGAIHYLTKPLSDDELLTVTRRVLGELDAEDELDRARYESSGQDFHGIATRDPAMRPVLDAIRRVGPSTVTVLVQGESGTGKERVAHALHAVSPRGRGPFVAFNAAAVPESLAEAELFGSRRGAYTGADRDRKGLFCEADGGTLFIDEVASMPLSVQGKLLRVLEDRRVTAVGASVPAQVDVRIVAATNVDLRKLVAEGTFRRDLYYRLSVVRVVIPPLRARLQDIPLLVQRFVDRHPGEDARRLTPAGLRCLLQHDWPGNVRELQNVVERALLLCSDDELGPESIQLEETPLDDWDEPGAAPEGGADLGYEEAKRQTLDRFQRRYVERALAGSRGNIAAAARRAGITRAAFHRIVKRLGLGELDA